ncbi:hypothetical protein [Jatrophihabitans fulvus]
MKPGATPQLTKKWWDDNKARTLQKTGIGDLLARFQIAVTKKDEPLVLKTISELEGKIADAIKRADPKQHAETIAGLHKYTAQLGDQRKAAHARIEKAKTPPPQKFGRPGVLWEIDVSAQVRKKADPDWLATFTGWTLKLVLDDELIHTIRGNGEAAILQFMVSDAQKVGDGVVKALADRVADLDSLPGKSPQDTDAARENFQRDVTKVMQAAEARLKAIPEERWKLFVSRQKQYTVYKVKSGVAVTAGTLGIVASAAGIVGTGGAGLALGIIGLTRGAATLTTQLVDLYVEADTVGDRLKKSCDTLTGRYTSAKKQAGNEVGATIIRGLLGTNPFVDSLPEAEKTLKLWSDKVAGLSGKLQETSDKITEAIDQSGLLEQKIRRAESKEAKAVLAKLEKLQAELGTMLDKAFVVGGSISRFEEAQPTAEKLFKQLRDENSNLVEIFEKGFPLFTSMALTGVNAAQGFSAAKDAQKYAKASVGLAMSLGKNAKELYETLG